MSKVRGVVVQSRLDYLENNFERPIYNKVLSELSAPVRHAFGEQVFLTSLYAFERLKELDNAISACIDKSPEEIFKEIGVQHAEKMIDRYFFNYIDAQDPQRFLAQVEKLHDNLWNFGKYSYQKSSQKSAELVYEFEEEIHPSYLNFLKSVFLHGIELCGGKDVKIDVDCTDAEEVVACKFKVSWK